MLEIHPSLSPEDHARLRHQAIRQFLTPQELVEVYILHGLEDDEHREDDDDG